MIAWFRICHPISLTCRIAYVNGCEAGWQMASREVLIDVSS